MKYQHLREFFEKYVEQYAPYRDDEVYNAVIEYLKDYYFKDMYCDIPYIFKKLWETNVIDRSIYEIILESDGFPKDLIDKLTTSEKEILLRSFLDYHRYSGTIYFLKKVAEQFHNHINVYELYVDYKDGEWCFIPRLVYKDVDLNVSTVLDFRLDYDYVYNKAQKFYIAKNQLEQLRLERRITLPLKTNLILLDYYVVYDKTSAFDNLINMATISNFSNTRITLFFSYVLDEDLERPCLSEVESEQFIDINKQLYSISFLGWYQLYYYVFYKYYNTQFKIYPFLQMPIVFPSTNFIYSLNDLRPLIEEYNSIQTSFEATEFFRKYIREPFLRFNNIANEMTIDELEEILRAPTSYVPSEVLDYVNTRIERTVNVQTETISILDELLYSMKTFMYTLDNDDHRFYIEHLIESMPVIVTDIELTPEYLLITEFKPFHTQLINEQHVKIVSNGKFNIVTPYDNKCEVLKYDKPSIVTPSDTDSFDIRFQYNESNPVISQADLSVNYKECDSCETRSRSLLDICHESVSNVVVSDDFNIYVS